MRKIKKIGCSVHGLLFLISLFLLFSRPSDKAFFLLVTSSFLSYYFWKAIMVTHTIKNGGSYEDQIMLVDSSTVKKTNKAINNISTDSFKPIRFWTVIIGLCHFTYGLKAMVNVIQGNFPVIGFVGSLLFMMKLLLLLSGALTVFYIVTLKYFYG